MTARNLEMHLKIDMIQRTQVLNIEIVDTLTSEHLFQKEGEFAGTYRLQAGDQVRAVVIATSLPSATAASILCFSFSAVPDCGLGEDGLSPFDLECASFELKKEEWGGFEAVPDQQNTFTNKADRTFIVQQLDHRQTEDGTQNTVEAQWASFGFLSVKVEETLNGPTRRLYFSDPEFSLGSS